MKSKNGKTGYHREIERISTLFTELQNGNAILDTPLHSVNPITFLLRVFFSPQSSSSSYGSKSTVDFWSNNILRFYSIFIVCDKLWCNFKHCASNKKCEKWRKKRLKRNESVMKRWRTLDFVTEHCNFHMAWQSSWCTSYTQKQTKRAAIKRQLHISSVTPVHTLFHICIRISMIWLLLSLPLCLSPSYLLVC